MITSKDFCEKLREGVSAMINGDMKEIVVHGKWLESNMDEESIEKLTPQYLRNIATREANKYGKGIEMRSRTCDETGYRITTLRLKDCNKAKIVNEKDIPTIQAKAVEKFASKILNLMPNVMHLEGVERDGAIEGISLYQKMIRELLNGE